MCSLLSDFARFYEIKRLILYQIPSVVSSCFNMRLERCELLMKCSHMHARRDKTVCFGCKERCCNGAIVNEVSGILFTLVWFLKVRIMQNNPVDSEITEGVDESIPRVFLIDDESFVLEYVAKVIDACGYRVVGKATSGVEAIECLEGIEVDLIIMDVSMPGIQGDDLLNILIQHCPGVKIIMLTSRNSIDLIKKCKKNGAIGYLLKTGDFESLVEKINKIWSKNLGDKNLEEKGLEEKGLEDKKV